MIRDRTEYADLVDLVRPLAAEWSRREAEREARERRRRREAADTARGPEAPEKAQAA